MLKLLAETKLTITESLSFSFLFFHLVKILYAKCSFYLPNEKNIFYGNLNHSIPERLRLLISKGVCDNFAERFSKISVSLVTLICLWRTLTSLCTFIPTNSLRALVFVIAINSGLMPSWLVAE